jgi:hypothetical protein
MRVEKARIPIRDFIKVWCEQCGIRIDPNEERTGVGGKTYHPHCLLPAGLREIRVVASGLLSKAQ